jgi:hypothetical protein
LLFSHFLFVYIACRSDLTHPEKEDYLKDAIEYIIDACSSRPLTDNIDLHYIATCQLGQILLAVKRTVAASKCYGKILFVLSVLLNRSIFNLSVKENKLRDDLSRHTTQSIFAAVRETKWIKLHLGPTKLHEKVTPGYAAWSFEDIPSARHSLLAKQDSLDIIPASSHSHFSTSLNVPKLDDSVTPLVVFKASPPKGIPPLQLPNKNFKKVYLSGEEINDSDIHKTSSVAVAGAGHSSVPSSSLVLSGITSIGNSGAHFKPPVGAVPLSALGHSIPADYLLTGNDNSEADSSVVDQKKIEQEILEGKRAAISPYTLRLRSKVPPVEEMIEIDKANRVSYGNSKGKIVHLIPNKALRDQNKPATSAVFDQKYGKKPAIEDEKKMVIYDLDKKSKKNRMKEDEKEEDELNVNKDEDHDAEEDQENGTDEEHENDNDGNGEENLKLTVGEAIIEDEDELGKSSPSPEPSPGTRARSKRVAKSSDSVVDSTTAAVRGNPTQKEKKGLFGFFSGGGKKAVKFKQSSPSSSHKAQNKKKPTTSAAKKPFFSSWFRKKPKPMKIEIDKTKLQKEKKLSDLIGFWSSKQAYYVFMLNSRQSRMELTAKCKTLRVLEGERVMNTLYSLKPSYMIRFQQLRQLLTGDCSKLVKSCPNSLKELSQLSLFDLQILFRSQNKMVRNLDEFEFFLSYKITKYDVFLPMILMSPVFTRDLSNFDDSLLDAERLVSNVAFEKVITDGKLEETKSKNHPLSPVDRLGIAEVDKRKRKNDNDDHATSLSPLSKKSSSHHTKVSSVTSKNSNIYNTDLKKGNKLTSTELQQKEEEKEEVLAGKMTYALSQSLDGSNYIPNGGQQGAKDMLIKYLGMDECLMIWNLPIVAHHSISVVLIWRENSLSSHEFFTAKESINARLYDESQQKKNAYKELKEKNMKQNNDNNSNCNSNGAKGRKNLGEIKGIVMEFGKCDLESSHLLQYIQRYLDALHSEPLSKRVTLTSDALRAMSCALSMTELLLMIPLHVRSLVICCPPMMRIIPWHLLLVETMKTREQIRKETGTIASIASKGFVSQSDEEEQRKDDETEEVVEVHLLEKYCVRLGPSLSLFELNSLSGSQLRHSVGHHRLVAVDCDDHDDMTSISPTKGNKGDSSSTAAVHALKKQTKQHHAGGIRGADLEVASIAHTWSADPDDYHILSDHAASYVGWETSTATGENQALYSKFKDEMELSFQKDKRRSKGLDSDDDEEEAHNHDSDSEEDSEEEEKKEMELDAKASVILKKMRKNRKKNYLFKKKKESRETGGNDDDNDDADEDSEEEDEEKELNEEEEIKEERRIHREHVKALTLCRVLHVCANKTLLFQTTPNDDHNNNKTLRHGKGKINEKTKEKKKKLKASIIIPKCDPYSYQSSSKRTLSSQDIIKRLYLKNCGLVVLSKFGITDDVYSVNPSASSVSGNNPPFSSSSSVIDVNWDFIEAFHLSGVSTVLFPLWEGSNQGIGTLAHIIFLIRFYSILPSKSNDRLSIVETCRRTQLWLKDVTANDCIAFIHKAPIPSKARQVIIDEMESYVNSFASKQTTKKKKDRRGISSGGEEGEESDNDRFEEKEGNRVGGNHKFFTHFLNWGSFIVSGYGGNIHHPDLTHGDGRGEKGRDNVDDQEFDAIFGNHVKTDDPLSYSNNLSSDWNDKELNNIEFEASVLRMEGKIQEALELEKQIRKLKLEKWKKRMNKLKETGWKAARGFKDTIDYFDKMLLDQDEEEISVSSEGSENDEEKLRNDPMSSKKKPNQRIKTKEEKVARKSPKYEMRNEDEDEEDEDPIDGGSRLLFDNNINESPMKRKQKKTALKSIQEEGSEKNLQSSDERRQFRPLDLDKRKNERAIYQEWKSKVGDLNMEVKQPTLPAEHWKKKRSGAGNPKQPHIKKKDNYDFAMMKNLKAKGKGDDVDEDESDDGYLDDEDEEKEDEDSDIDNEEDDEDEEEDTQERKKQKQKKNKGNEKNKKSGWKGVFGEVRSYAEIAQMLSEQYPLKVLDEKLQHLEEEKGKCIIF